MLLLYKVASLQLPAKVTSEMKICSFSFAKPLKCIYKYFSNKIARKHPHVFFITFSNAYTVPDTDPKTSPHVHSFFTKRNEYISPQLFPCRVGENL